MNTATLPYSAILSQPKPSHAEDLAAPISGQFRSSPFYVAISSLPIAGLTAIALTAICYAVLPKEAADSLAPQLQLYTLGTGAVGSAGGVLGMVKRGLDITNGKIAAQSPPAAPANMNIVGDVNTVPAPAPPAVDAALPPTRREYSDPVLPHEISGETEDDSGENENILSLETGSDEDELR